MRWLRPWNTLVFVASAIAHGCGPGGPDQRSTLGPTLVPIDSILLPEADTLYIGNPYSPVIDPFDGSIYIPDIFSNRVLRFGRDGRLITTYGRPGDGPGEFRGTGIAFVLDDSTVAAQDTRTRRLYLFDRKSGVFRRHLQLPGLMGITPPLVSDSIVWAAIWELHKTSSLLRWDLRTDELTELGAIPSEYERSVSEGHWRFASNLHHSALAPLPGGFALGWAGLDELFVLSTEGVIRDTVSPPHPRRRGVPSDIRERFDVERIGLRERLEVSSHLRQLFATPDGGLFFTHHDQTALRLEPMPVLTAKVWVGAIAPDLKRACVDTPVPIRGEVRPMETFRGDTLFVLDRRLEPTGALKTWILMYLVDLSSCDWLDA